MNKSDFRNLMVWQKAMTVSKMLYLTANQLPADERYGLVSQIKRAAVSVPSNIAEGHGRGAPKEFIHFLHVSRGSICELITQITLCNELNFITNDQYCECLSSLNEVDKMIWSLIRAINQNIPDKNNNRPELK